MLIRHGFLAFLLLYSLLATTPLLAQTVTLRGRIVDATTNQPLPYASVGVAGTNLGTTANDDGVFKLALNANRLPLTLTVSYMGYGSAKQHVQRADKALTIRLQPGDKTLREVVVMPDSSLWVLLKTAFGRIEQNYITRPTRFTGFFREAMKTDRNQFAYFGEALLSGYVSGYQNATEEGQFEVLRSRINHFPGYDTLRLVKFYASVFSFLTDDPVKQRTRYIQPDFKRYAYQLAEMSEYDGRPVYVIAFHSKDKTDTTDARLSGRFFIEKNSLAFISFELESSPTLAQKDGSIVRKAFRTNIVYRPVGQKWHLERFFYERDYDQTDPKRSVSLALEGLVTEIDTANPKPIAYDKRLEYGQVFSALKDDSTSTFWDGQTILEPSRPLLVTMQAAARALPPKTATPTAYSITAADLAQQKPTVGKVLLLGLRTFMAGLETRYNLTTAPYGPLNQGFTLGWPQGPGGPTYPTTSARAVWPVGLVVFGLGYSVNKRWLLTWGRSFDAQPGLDWGRSVVDLRYAILLKRRGNPLLMRPGIGYFAQNVYRDVTTLTNVPVTLGGTTLNAREIGLGVGERSRGIHYSARFDYKLQGKRWLFLTVGYQQPLMRQLRAYATEQSGFFLFRSDASASLSELGATASIEGKPLSELPGFRPFFAEVGLRWSLR
jgi:hypothetical protein